MADTPDPTSERDLLAPLVAFYVREMGAVPGRLMAVLSLLTDLENSVGWASQDLAARRAVGQARLITRDALKLAVTDDDGRG